MKICNHCKMILAFIAGVAVHAHFGIPVMATAMIGLFVSMFMHRKTVISKIKGLFGK